MNRSWARLFAAPVLSISLAGLILPSHGVAADRQRPNPGRLDASVERLDILDAIVEAEARANRHIADIGRPTLGPWDDSEPVIVGPDALDIAHRPRSEARARPIGDAQIHRHPDQRDIECTEIRQVRSLRSVG